MSRANQWFVPGDGIAREVITADIQRYLGPDALVRPGAGTGEYEGRSGYWITAYRTLTSQMIQDLKMDSQRWQQERAPGEGGRGGSHSPYAPSAKVSRGPDASVVAYQDSRTHAARQHWGPSEVQTLDTTTRQTSRQPYSNTTYATSEQHYTTTPTAYGQQYSHQPPAHTQPRTQPTDPYAYGQPPAREHASYPSQASYAYPPVQPTQDPYGRQTVPPPTHGHSYATPSAAPAPGYYIASDGRQYPLAQQPSQQQNPNNPRRRG